eukprot:scaffold286_cov52-Attheya_sp.AAC.2
MESVEDSYMDGLMQALPWEVVMEFLTLNEILSARCVAHHLAGGAESLSPQHCAHLLSETLMKRNIYALNSWKRDGGMIFSWAERLLRRAQASQTTVPLSSTAAATESSLHTSDWFDQMLHVYRVLKHLPNEFLIGFNHKHGRHCLPLSKPNMVGPSIVQYPPCQRSNCATCDFQIPNLEVVGHHVRQTQEDYVHDSSAEHASDEDGSYKFLGRDINDILQVPGKDGALLDMTRFYNTCVPNLPSNLRCPYCRSSERTLVLSETSYLSESMQIKRENVLLTFTPRYQECQAVDDESIADFAPLYNDVVMHERYHCLVPDAKEAVSIHCVGCNQFGVLSPAEPCFVPNHAECFVDVSDTHAGSSRSVRKKVFVRSQCTTPDCLYPVKCSGCENKLIKVGPLHTDSDVCCSNHSKMRMCVNCRNDASNGILAPSCDMIPCTGGGQRQQVQYESRSAKKQKKDTKSSQFFDDSDSEENEFEG